jgi:hypothetical protein
MTPHTSRRDFLRAAPLALAVPGLVGTSPLHGGERPQLKGVASRDLESLVGLILETPRNRCVEVLAGEMKRGVSYRQALAGLFHAAVRHQGTHEVAMMLSAHRISGELPVKDALLPLFWAFDSLARRIASVRKTEPVVRPLAAGPFPPPAKAAKILHDAMKSQDRDAAELAAVALHRTVGARQTMELVWRYACRDSDDLGHKAIACVNVWRALDAVGWEHAEIPLRYALGGSARQSTDPTYEGSLTRLEATLPKLPPDWASPKADHKATLELYEEVRAARTDAAADLVCRQLLGGTVQAGSVWDAVHLAAADLLVRFKTREKMGGWPVHAVTSSNALHFAFRTAMDAETRLLLLLQAVSRISDVMTKLSLKHRRLRELHVTELEPADIPTKTADAVDAIFSILPYKHTEHKEKDALDRPRDDEACRKAFAFLRIADNRSAFMHAACDYVSRKATWNAHDFKFPAAAFEDVSFVSERWRPHFLAATVHVLHGPASDDATVFEHARESLSKL